MNAIPIFASADNEDRYLLHLVNRKPFPFFSKATGVDILNSFKVPRGVISLGIRLC